ncbi:MAG: hypothetical protein ACK47C_07800 [Paracoccaceae bacterium]
MKLTPIIALAFVVGAIAIWLKRHARALRPIADPRSANRADCARSRRHWAGAPDSREAGE